MRPIARNGDLHFVENGLQQREIGLDASDLVLGSQFRQRDFQRFQRFRRHSLNRRALCQRSAKFLPVCTIQHERQKMGIGFAWIDFEAVDRRRFYRLILEAAVTRLVAYSGTKRYALAPSVAGLSAFDIRSFARSADSGLTSYRPRGIIFCRSRSRSSSANERRSHRPATSMWATFREGPRKKGGRHLLRCRGVANRPDEPTANVFSAKNNERSLDGDSSKCCHREFDRGNRVQPTGGEAGKSLRSFRSEQNRARGHPIDEAPIAQEGTQAANDIAAKMICASAEITDGRLADNQIVDRAFLHGCHVRQYADGLFGQYETKDSLKLGRWAKHVDIRAPSFDDLD